MKTIAATASVIPAKANTISLQLATRECGGDENGMLNLITARPDSVTPRQRKLMADFLVRCNVESIPHYQDVGDFYSEGKFRIKYARK